MRAALSLLLLLASALSAADYSDVLLVSNSNSPVSLQIAQYFSQQRNLTHELAVSMPTSEKIRYDELQRTLISPLKKYLNESGARINYIVLTKGIPLYTDETDVFAVGNDMSKANASSVDSEIALLNSRYETGMGAKGYAINAYHGKSEPFSHEKFGGYLVTRLDGYDYVDVKGMIDRAGATSQQGLAAGQHVALDFRGIYGYQLSRARQMLNESELPLYSSPAQLKDEAQSGMLAQSQNPNQPVSYYDTFGCYNLGGCNASYSGVPGYKWANGALVSIKYSFSARTSRSPQQSQDFSGWPRSFIADYLHAGATGGVGYAVEPMSSQVANPEYFAQSYLSGRNLAEILWSAVPSLSWSAVAYGDPKVQYPKLKNETAAPIAQPQQPSPKANKSRATPPAPSANNSSSQEKPKATPAGKNAGNEISEQPRNEDLKTSAEPEPQAQAGEPSQEPPPPPRPGQASGETTHLPAQANPAPNENSASLPFLQGTIAFQDGNLPAVAGAILALAVAAGLYLLSRWRGR